MIEPVDPLYYRKVQFCLDGDGTGCDDKSGGSANPLVTLNGEKLVPTVSWDTVPIEGSGADDEVDDYMSYEPLNLDSSMDYLYSGETELDYMKNPARSKNYLSQAPTSRVRGSSPVRLGFGAASSAQQLDVGVRDTAAKIMIGPGGEIRRRDYPSRPILVSNALIKSQYHKDWKKKWRKQVETVEYRIGKAQSKYFKYPEILFPEQKVDLTDAPVVNENGEVIEKRKRANLRRQLRVIRTPTGIAKTPRTVLVHISGRRHTWVALDWAINQLANDTDYIVILTNIPERMTSDRRRSLSRSRSRSASRSRSRSRSRMRSLSRNREIRAGTGDDVIYDDYDPSDDIWCDGYTVGEVNALLQRLIDYCTIIMGDRKVKLTIEIVVGSTSKVLINSLNAYAPDFFVIGTPVDRDGSNNVVIHRCRHLSPIVMQNFPIPLFVVAARKMGWFELRLQREILLKQKQIQSSRVVPNINTSTIIDKLDGTSRQTDSSDEDEADNISHLSLDDMEKTVSTIKQLRRRYRSLLEKKMGLLDVDSTLSTKQRHFEKIDSTINATLNFNKELESLGDAEYVMQIRKTWTGGIRPRITKKKSMLDVSDIPRKKPSNVNPSTAPAIDIAKVTKLSQQGDKKKDLTPSSVSSRPSNANPAAIKFAHSVKPKDGMSAIQRIKTVGANNSELSSLEKDLSSISLVPVRSHQPKSESDSTLRKVMSTTSLDKKERKRSRLFTFLFGGNQNSSSVSDSNSDLSPSLSSTSSRRGSMSSQSSGESKKKRGLYLFKKLDHI